MPYGILIELEETDVGDDKVLIFTGRIAKGGKIYGIR